MKRKISESHASSSDYKDVGATKAKKKLKYSTQTFSSTIGCCNYNSPKNKIQKINTSQDNIRDKKVVSSKRTEKRKTREKKSNSRYRTKNEISTHRREFGHNSEMNYIPNSASNEMSAATDVKRESDGGVFDGFLTGLDRSQVLEEIPKASDLSSNYFLDSLLGHTSLFGEDLSDLPTTYCSLQPVTSGTSFISNVYPETSLTDLSEVTYQSLNNNYVSVYQSCTQSSDPVLSSIFASQSPTITLNQLSNTNNNSHCINNSPPSPPPLSHHNSVSNLTNGSMVVQLTSTPSSNFQLTYSNNEFSDNNLNDALTTSNGQHIWSKTNQPQCSEPHHSYFPSDHKLETPKTRQLTDNTTDIRDYCLPKNKNKSVSLEKELESLNKEPKCKENDSKPESVSPKSHLTPAVGLVTHPSRKLPNTLAAIVPSSDFQGENLRVFLEEGIGLHGGKQRSHANARERDRTHRLVNKQV